MNIPLQGKEFMKRSPGNISKSDPSTVPAVDLTEVRIDIFVCGHFLFFWRHFHIACCNYVSQVQLALAEQQSQLPMTARAAVSGIIPDNDQPQVG